MTRVWKDIAFQAGKYQDRDGKERTRYQPGGKICVEPDGRMWGVLEFLGQSVTFSVFDQREKGDQGETGRGGARNNSATRESSAGPREPIDDDIPF